MGQTGNKKYLIFRSLGNLDRQVNKHELVAVEYGEDIDSITEGMVKAVADDPAKLPEYHGCETAAFAPEIVQNRKVK